MEENEVISKEKELVKRIEKLDINALKAALFSISDLNLLDDIVKIGEDFQQARKK